MTIKKILKNIRCKLFCCFKSSCSYNSNDINDIDLLQKKKKSK